jgi:hypothetical protein
VSIKLMIVVYLECVMGSYLLSWGYMNLEAEVYTFSLILTLFKILLLAHAAGIIGCVQTPELITVICVSYLDSIPCLF